MSVNWFTLGELQVTDVWQLLPYDALADTFRITTTITDTVGWDTQRIRSGAHVRFKYLTEPVTTSKNFYIPVLPNATIYELPVPRDYRDLLGGTRGVEVRLSSRWVGKINFTTGFAKWNIKIEEPQDV